MAKFNGTEHVDDHYADNISLVNDGDNTIKDVVVSQGTISAGVASNGPDIIWGTTAHHWGMTAPVKEYNRSYAIAPRTGGVPIVFEHVMSKITFALETTTADDNKKVNLEGATIAISNLYTQGKIKLDDLKNNLKDTIRELMSDEEKRSTIGQLASDYVKKEYAPEVIAGKISEFLEN